MVTSILLLSEYQSTARNCEWWVVSNVCPGPNFKGLFGNRCTQKLPLVSASSWEEELLFRKVIKICRIFVRVWTKKSGKTFASTNLTWFRSRGHPATKQSGSVSKVGGSGMTQRLRSRFSSSCPGFDSRHFQDLFVVIFLMLPRFIGCSAWRMSTHLVRV